MGRAELYLLGLLCTTVITSLVFARINGDSCQCGIASRERIIGGEKVEFAQKYPWQVSLQYKNQHYCGGSIINDRWILTAAHCINVKSMKKNFGLENPITIVVGEHIHSSLDDNHDTFTKEYSVAQYIEHPHYMLPLNDLALLELSEPIVFGDVIRPVCLPQQNVSLYADEPGITLGWGRTSDENTKKSDILKELKVTIHSSDECKKWHEVLISNDVWSYMTFIYHMMFGHISNEGWSIDHPSFICASGDPGSNVCKGDSGGPLMVFDDNLKRYVLVGVASFVKKGNKTHTDCDNPDYPGVYARVTEELTWINEVSSNGKRCN